MSKLRMAVLLLALSIGFSSCIILTPRRPHGGYRHGYGHGYGYRHHYHHGHGHHHR